MSNDPFRLADVELPAQPRAGISPHPASRARTRIFVALAVAGLLAVGAAPASASSVWWHVTSSARPSNLPPGGQGTINIAFTDVGDSSVVGGTEPVLVSDTLPAGVTATAIVGTAGIFNERSTEGITCDLVTLSCQFTGTYPPFERLEVNITVAIAHDAVPESNSAAISGGQATSVKIDAPVAISGEPPAFGIESFELTPEEQGGAVVAQAGSHPYQLTTALTLNQTIKTVGGQLLPEPVQLPKNITFSLPPGLVGNATKFPRCSGAQFGDYKKFYPGNACAPETAIGVAQLDISARSLAGNKRTRESGFAVAVPVFNLVPNPGEPARFAFSYEGRPVFLETAVQTGEGYRVIVSARNLTEQVGILGSLVTLWGEPQDPRHNASRGWACIANGEFVEVNGALGKCTPPAAPNQTPFLRLPTSCHEPLASIATASAWSEPEDLISRSAPFTSSPDGLTGCDRVPFAPSVTVSPDARSTASPTGLTVALHLPQEANEAPEGIATSDLEDTTLTLPQGVALNPSAAVGLVGCSEAQIALDSPGPGHCPDASKVGTVRIRTPLLPGELEGAVFLASPQNFPAGLSENPFRSLIALYIVAQDPVSKVVVKLAGKVTPNETTGQLTTTFENTPQLPFEDLKLSFFGGARAPLSTPSSCGTYTSEASFTPYSGGAAVQSSSRFEITSGAEGAGCPSSHPFAPSFVAGTTGPQAGVFSPFTLTFSRRDQDQNLGAITVHTPPGLLGNLASVPLCAEAQANAGTCSAASQIGDTTTEAGVGSEPVTLPQSGEGPDPVYLTGPYGGQPFGLSFVVPAIAGPFNLGTVVVRASIAVDPVTSALTITSNALPTMLRGVPLDIKTVNVTVNRPGFMFNPTSCAAQAIGATITSSQGASAPVFSPFQATNCATLPFKPVLSVSTAGRASKAGGASLDVKINSKGGPGAAGEEANIRSVKVDLPIKLVSRLTTLQKACLAKVFEADPAACPKESDVGSASATTPVLTHPLAGPAYLVSHGGEAFPSLEIVLQGEGITLILEGKTNIKKGVTSSTFRTVPDAPISSFELKLPTGKFSILAANLPASANYNFCGQTLAMPTAITGQNGAVYKPATKVAVTGCPKAKKKTAKKKAKPKKAKSSGRSK